MRPTNGYSDALDALIRVSPFLQPAATSVRIRLDADDWVLDVTGTEGHHLDRLVRHMGLMANPDGGSQSGHYAYRTWTGRVGRVAVKVTGERHILHRVGGRA